MENPRGALGMHPLVSRRVAQARLLGLLLSYQMIAIINRRAFGWTITFQPDWQGAWVSLLLALVSALIAGLYPAWRWSREQQDEALRERE